MTGHGQWTSANYWYDPQDPYLANVTADMGEFLLLERAGLEEDDPPEDEDDEEE